MFEEYGKAIGFIIGLILIIAIVSVGIRAMMVSTDKAIIENSKSYIDSRNEKASVLIQEYDGAKEGSQKYLKLEICEIEDELQDDSSKLLAEFAKDNCEENK